MIYWANEISAVISTMILILCARGFLPWIRLGSWTDPRTWVTIMVLGMDTKGISRMFYWDMYRPLRAYLAEGRMVVGTIEGTLINTSFNTAAGLMGICGLLALYYSIPEGKRAGWNIFTAPFYPDGFRLGIWRRKGD